MEKIAEIDSFGNKIHLSEEMSRLSEYIKECATEGRAVHEVEQGIWDKLLEIGKYALAHFFKLQGDGDMGEILELPDGKIVNRLKKKQSRTYRSIFANYELQRVVYGSREGQKVEFVPLDNRLHLPEGRFSYLLQDWDQQLSIENPFNQANRVLNRLLKLNQPIESLERITYDGAESVSGFRDTLAPVKPQKGNHNIVLTADSKGIPIKKDNTAKPIEAHAHKKGPKPDRKRMAIVGAAYSATPNRRSAQDIVDSLFREKPLDPKNKPDPPQDKRLRASLNRVEGKQCINATEEIFTWLAEESRQRNPLNTNKTIVLMDGQPSLWKAVKKYGFPEDRTEILDLLHVTPRLWEAAGFFYKEDTEKLPFIKERLYKILQGDVKGVIRGLRQMGSKRKLKSKPKNSLRVISNYFEKNQDRMQYHEYLEKGYPIASGVIEGACRHFVKDRMERAGMRWTIKGAQALLDIRSVYLNDQWDEFTQYRIKKELDKLYPNKSVVERYEWRLTA